jgi:hypothetical protein
VRLLGVLALLMACGIQPAPTEALGSGSGFGGGGGGEPTPAPGEAECEQNSDCTLAASTCCECPTFALPTYAEPTDGCSDVMCPPLSCGSNVKAACVAGTCEIACTPLACNLACANGFVVDASGCLTCACAQPPPDACVPGPAGTDDNDACVEVPADCCGCARGGKDTAVLASQAAAFAAALSCPADPQCPEINTCDPAAQATCSDGQCELLDISSQPSNECGLVTAACEAEAIDNSLQTGTGLACPTCPSGEVCVINAIDAANARHVGVCLESAD